MTKFTLRLSTNETDLMRAADLMRAGKLVALPTETVYGLGADARNGAAVAQIYEAKGRPSFNPLIVHVASADEARLYAQWSDDAEKLAAAFWPGPLTMVLPLRPEAGLSSLVTAGLQTVAIRVPAHPLARAILRAFGGPVAAPSANPSGRISPTTAAHVLAGLDGRIDAVVDGGCCRVGLESTIIGLGGETPALLRPGGIPLEEAEAVMGRALPAPVLDASASDPQVSAPGQLSSHYAPGAPVRLNAHEPGDGELFLGFGPGPADLNLSPKGDLAEAAATLFDALHRLDALKPGGIAVAPIPERGLGKAINDRLRRAAAPRG